MTGECSLCGLPTPDPPVTAAADAGGTYCCRGCLEVARVVDDVEAVDAAAVRERARGESEPEEDDDLAEAFLAIDGMHCTTCESFVALRGEAHEGVAAIDASYATDTARVRYDPEQVDVEVGFDLPPLRPRRTLARIPHLTDTTPV